jgi:predicted phosphodiesterase
MKIAVISDIHEDIVSLKKALKMIEIEKCNQIVCLGDILGYPFIRGKYADTKNAAECIDLIKKNCSIVLLGNHDVFHLKKIPKYCNGFQFPSKWYEMSIEEKKEISKGKVWNYSDDLSIIVSEKDNNYLSKLPEFLINDYGEVQVLFSHFNYPNFTGYVSGHNSDDQRIKEHFNFMKKNSCKISICGHTHIEGLGICYESNSSIISQLLGGFMYYSYGERRIKDKYCCISIPALADNGQVNGFAIIDTTNLSINAISLNTNRRFIM